MIRPTDIAQLRANHREQLPLRGSRQERDFWPVVKLHVPQTGLIWLLTELDEDEIAFGLCDLGMGCPELGYVALEELREVAVHSLSVVQDVTFCATKPLSEYAREAMRECQVKA